MEVKMKQILDNVQTGPFNHQKNLKLLENVYYSAGHEKFLPYYLQIIQGILQENYKNPCFKLLTEFLAKFSGYIAKDQNPETLGDTEDDPPTHPFLSAVLKEVIKHHDLPIQECRYIACSFVSQVLQNIGDQTQIDSQVCDMIQNAMLDNIQDPKPLIRLQAVSALVRLQDPLNPECPVISAYLKCLKDCNHLVRREAVKRIAPNALTIPKIKERTRDTDANVRSAAFTHAAEIGIRCFKIVHRQFILNSGFNETNKQVKKTFLEYLLPRWLTALKGDYIGFLNAIKLDAEESDILNTEELSKKVLEVFFKIEPIGDLIKALPLDENKVIPLNSMRNELALYWNILTRYLRKSEEMEEYLDTVIPELFPFCNYIEKLISTKFMKTMEDWEFLDFQYMLYHLFDIAEDYDLSEEVGRKALDKLIKKILRNHRLQPRLLSKIMHIGSKLSTNKDSFTNEICLIISDIREPLIDQPTPHEQREKEFKIAELKVKLNILQGDLEDAVDGKEFAKAQQLENEMAEYRRKMEEISLQSSQGVSQVRVSKNDPETICWCLDLLGALLKDCNIKTLSPSLLTCREEFLKPLIAVKNVEIGWRVFKCLAAYCVFDKQMAEDHVKQLMVPIASYRVIPNFNKTVLITSISIITDLIRMYGSEMFVTEEEQNTTTNTTRRRLYNEEVEEDIDLISNRMSVDLIVNVVLDMLDDESDEIRDTAVLAVAKLMLNGFPITPMVMTRLILKWYNPITQIHLQQKLGVIIHEYSERIKEAKSVISKAVVPILTNLAEAPKTSPLAEVNIENAVRFLAAITDSGYPNELGHVHRELAHILIQEISSRPSEVVVPHLAKMLNFLNVAPDNSPLTKELVTHAELILEKEIYEKSAKQQITKFIATLNENVTMNQEQSVVSTTADTTENNTVPGRLSTVIEQTEKETVATESEKTEAVVHNEEIPSKRRKLNSVNSNENADEEKSTTDSTSTTKEPPNSGELPQNNQADAVTSTLKTSEPLNIEKQSVASDSEVIPPSISPDSQEQVFETLRRMSTRSSCSQNDPIKQKTEDSKKTKKLKRSKEDKSKNLQKNNNDEEVESAIVKVPGSKETEKERSDGSRKAEGPVNGRKRKNEKIIENEDKREKNNKNKKNVKNIILGASSPSSTSSKDSGNNNSKLKDAFIPTSNNNVIKKNLRNQTETSNKDNSSGSQETIASSVSSERRSRRNKNKRPAEQNNTSKLKPGRLQNQRVLTSVSSSESIDSVFKKNRPNNFTSDTSSESSTAVGRRTSTKNAALTVVTRRSIKLSQKGNTDGALQSDTASETSSSNRSRVLMSESSSKTDVESNARPQVNRTSTRNGQNKQVAKKTVGRPKKAQSQETESAKGLSSKRSGTLNSESSSTSDVESNARLQENRTSTVNRKNKQVAKKIVVKPKKTQSMQAEIVKRIKKVLLKNNSRSVQGDAVSETSSSNKSRVLHSESSSTSDVRLQENKTATDNKKNKQVTKKIVDKPKKTQPQQTESAKGPKKVLLKNNSKSDSDVEKASGDAKQPKSRANVQKKVLRNTPQVKRKKNRGGPVENVTVEPMEHISQNLSDTSDQTLHTIIDQSSLFDMEFLPDSSPDNTPQKSLNNSRRIQVVTEYSSDSESMNNSPVRKSSRNRKKKIFFQ